MKRLSVILILAVLCAAILSFPVTAHAEQETYLEIDRDGVYLHENTRKADVLFVIPRTYYVKILDANYDPDYLLVEYNGVEGLIKGSEVSGKTLTDVANPYFTDINVSAHVDTYLYQKPAIASKTNLAAYGLTLTFLGKTQGEQHNFGTSTWFAVLYADRVYFIHPEMTGNISLLENFSPVHPNSVIAKETSAPAESEATEMTPVQDGSFDLVRLLLILGVIVPIVIIMFLLFHPKRRSRPVRRNSDRERYYRDEEEYDDY